MRTLLAIAVFLLLSSFSSAQERKAFVFTQPATPPKETRFYSPAPVVVGSSPFVYGAEPSTRVTTAPTAVPLSTSFPAGIVTGPTPTFVQGAPLLGGTNYFGGSVPCVGPT